MLPWSQLAQLFYFLLLRNYLTLFPIIELCSVHSETFILITRADLGTYRAIAYSATYG